MTKFTDWRIYNGGGQPAETKGRKVQVQTREMSRSYVEEFRNVNPQPGGNWNWDGHRSSETCIVAYRMVEQPAVYWLVKDGTGYTVWDASECDGAHRHAKMIGGTVLRVIEAPEEARDDR
jgi:hypothetical protein